MRAVSAVFTPHEQSRRERQKQVEKLATEITIHLGGCKAPRAVILCAGTRLVFAVPDTANCQRLLALRSSLLVGTYGPGSDPDRVKQDLEATLSEYYDGRPVVTHSKGASHA